MSGIDAIGGNVIRRGEAGYEQARRAAVWQQRKPERYPDVIVKVTCERDVVEAVRYARDHGLAVKARAGGHSFTGSAVRAGVLLDMSEWNEITIDEAARTATVTPGVRGGQLTPRLQAAGLFFPSGHSRDVGVGGYLLQGGFGWNGRTYGPACASVRAVDVVTADGEVIHSDATTNPDWLWAARGAGPGYFGVVTKYYLDLYPSPDSLLMSFAAFPLEAYDEVVPWYLETAKASPRLVEPWLLCGPPPGGGERGLGLLTIAYGSTTDEATAAIRPFDEMPFAQRSLIHRPAHPSTLDEGYDFFAPDGKDTEGRYCVDGAWVDIDDPGTLAAQIKPVFTTLPTPESVAIIMPWSTTPVDGAFSMQSAAYVSPMAIWNDPADDNRCVEWVSDVVGALDPISHGIQLADENLVNRPAPFMAPDRLARLEALRVAHDPEGRFPGYLTSDEQEG